VAVAFGVRCVDVLGHRLRTDACVLCGRRSPVEHGAVAVDVEAGGVVCHTCATNLGDAVRVAAATVTTLRRLRTLSWEEATQARLGRAESELHGLLERQVARLIGQPTRTSRFVREVERFSSTLGDRGRR
jgi:recombinational DNA repair protein (RecF pathway)